MIVVVIMMMTSNDRVDDVEDLVQRLVCVLLLRFLFSPCDDHHDTMMSTSKSIFGWIFLLIITPRNIISQHDGDLAVASEEGLRALGQRRRPWWWRLFIYCVIYWFRLRRIGVADPSSSIATRIQLPSASTLRPGIIVIFQRNGTSALFIILRW
jgi:hypothetical protein